jgi:lipid A ethanolaminephosphotransferase
MFSRLTHNQYDKVVAYSQQNVIDIAQLGGMDVLWIDNNNGSCKGVCTRVNTIEIEPTTANEYCDDEYCLDEALLGPLSNKLKQLSTKNTLIVLHMMGSHGPTYYRRYPKDKRVFTPDCARSDIQHCSTESLVNTYDNTIAYTDFVLNEIISQLTSLAHNSGRKTSLLYVSDHGESLGEKGAYLHGLPFAFAPKEQTHVPMIFWNNALSENYNLSCLKRQTGEVASHDNLFDTLLGITNITSRTYQAENDLISPCENPKYLALQPPSVLNTITM